MNDPICKDDLPALRFRIPRYNWFNVPNFVVDVLLPVLSLSEFSVLIVILRQTAGFQKKLDWISLSQFEKKTGLDKKTVLKALAGLQDYGCISSFYQCSVCQNQTPASYVRCPKCNNGRRPRRIYLINYDDEIPAGLIVEKMNHKPIVENLYHDSGKSLLSDSGKSLPTKYNITKDKKQKDDVKTRAPARTCEEKKDTTPPDYNFFDTAGQEVKIEETPPPNLAGAPPPLSIDTPEPGNLLNFALSGAGTAKPDKFRPKTASKPPGGQLVDERKSDIPEIPKPAQPDQQPASSDHVTQCLLSNVGIDKLTPKQRADLLDAPPPEFSEPLALLRTQIEKGLASQAKPPDNPDPNPAQIIPKDPQNRPQREREGTTGVHSISLTPPPQRTPNYIYPEKSTPKGGSGVMGGQNEGNTGLLVEGGSDTEEESPMTKEQLEAFREAVDGAEGRAGVVCHGTREMLDREEQKGVIASTTGAKFVIEDKQKGFRGIQPKDAEKIIKYADKVRLGMMTVEEYEKVVRGILETIGENPDCCDAILKDLGFKKVITGQEFEAKGGHTGAMIEVDIPEEGDQVMVSIRGRDGEIVKMDLFLSPSEAKEVMDMVDAHKIGVITGGELRELLEEKIREFGKDPKEVLKEIAEREKGVRPEIGSSIRELLPTEEGKQVILEGIKALQEQKGEKTPKGGIMRIDKDFEFTDEVLAKCYYMKKPLSLRIEESEGEVSAHLEEFGAYGYGKTETEALRNLERHLIGDYELYLRNDSGVIPEDTRQYWEKLEEYLGKIGEPKMISFEEASKPFEGVTDEQYEQIMNPIEVEAKEVVEGPDFQPTRQIAEANDREAFVKKVLEWLDEVRKKWGIRTVEQENYVRMGQLIKEARKWWGVYDLEWIKEKGGLIVQKKLRGRKADEPIRWLSYFDRAFENMAREEVMWGPNENSPLWQDRLPRKMSLNPRDWTEEEVDKYGPRPHEPGYKGFWDMLKCGGGEEE